VLALLGVAVIGPISACLHVAGLALASYIAAALSYHLYEVHFLRLKRYFA
jgi:peptidoglycan/LPS O-acetylase OafA/YrhL